MIINTLPHQLDEVSCLDPMFNKDSSVHNWFSQRFPVGHASPQSFSAWENHIHILVRLDWHLRLQARHPSLVHVNLALENRPVLCAMEGTGTSHSKLETRLGPWFTGRDSEPLGGLWAAPLLLPALASFMKYLWGWGFFKQLLSGKWCVILRSQREELIHGLKVLPQHEAKLLYDDVRKRRRGAVELQVTICCH